MGVAEVVVVLQDGPLDGMRIGVPAAQFSEACERGTEIALVINSMVDSMPVQLAYDLDAETGVAYYQHTTVCVDARIPGMNQEDVH